MNHSDASANNDPARTAALALDTPASTAPHRPGLVAVGHHQPLPTPTTLRTVTAPGTSSVTLACAAAAGLLDRTPDIGETIRRMRNTDPAY